MTGKAKASRREPPPKRTGKRGIGPLNAEKDFDTPTKRDPDQRALIEVRAAENAPAVVKQKMRVNYVRPHFERLKSGKRTVALEMSFALTDDHDDLLPKRIKEGWTFMTKKGFKRLDIVEVPGQHVAFFMAPDMEESVVLPAAKVSHVSLQVIEETGSGKEKKVIRLSFRLQVEMGAEVAKFAEWNFGDELWMEMHESQEELFDEEFEEA